MEIRIAGTAGLDDAARQLLDFINEEKILLFEGDMGAGKTTFIKSIAKEMGVTDLVSSPTFSIVNQYTAPGKRIYHFDFYRIKTVQEAYDIGYEEYFYSGDYCFIEWPEKVAELLPPAYVKTEIKIISENERLLRLTKI